MKTKDAQSVFLDVDNTHQWATDLNVMVFAKLDPKHQTPEVLKSLKIMAMSDRRLFPPAQADAESVEITKLSYAQAILNHFYQITHKMNADALFMKEQFHVIKNRIDSALMELKNESHF